MRISLVIASLGSGGAERVAALLANGFAGSGHEVTIITFSAPGSRPFYALASGISLIDTGTSGPERNLVRNMSRIRAIRETLRRSASDMVVSFIDQTNVLTLIATRGLGMPVVVTEHTPPDCYPLGWKWRLLRQLTYPAASACAGVSRGVATSFPPLARKRTRMIYNPIDIAAITAAPKASAGSTNAGRTLISVGRLHEEKGNDLLIEAFSRIEAKNPGWELHLWGEGPQEQELREMCRTKNIEDRVIFRGTTNDIYAVMKSADLFVLPSRYEGFGLALAEALACGLPAVSFDCPVGPREILNNGENGVLVPKEDTEALAASLDRLMNDPEERARLASQAPASVARFALPKVLDEWHALFDDLKGDAVKHQ